MKWNKFLTFLKWLRKKLHKVEFSKLMCGLIVLVLGLVSIYSIARYYSLCKLAIEYNSSVVPDSAAAVICISTVFASLLSYCLYQFGLKNSRNKYGVDANGQPYKEKISQFINEMQNETSELYNSNNELYNSNNELDNSNNEGVG